MGIKFFLNGKRINLRGDSYHFHGPVQMTRAFAENWYRMCIENGANYVRLHANPYPSFYLDAADEMGMLIVDETAMFGSGHDMAAGDPRYIERCRNHIRRLVQRDKNHPSVIIWSMGNEHYCPRGSHLFKNHIKEFEKIIHKLDPTRNAYLEGDKRLVPEKDTVFVSDHYSQSPLSEWIQNKKKPLIVGEHSGQWNIYPHDAFEFVGASAYLDIDNTSAGVAEREKIFIELARREDVPAISTYNLIFYSMHSMPDEDVTLEFDSLEGPGNKPMRIPRYSVTMNNGYLKDYPAYRPNPALAYTKAAYKPVTIIPQEYDGTFFDDADIERTYNIYNDTRHDQNCRIEFTVSLDNRRLLEEQFRFFQPVAERYDWKLKLPRVTVKQKAEMKLDAVLYHGETEVHRMEKTYTIYPASIKTVPVSEKRSIYYCGNDQAYQIISALVPNCERMDDFASLNSMCDTVIVGPHLDGRNQAIYKSDLWDYIRAGGSVVQLEQSQFNIGYADLVYSPRFSTHISIPNHPILEGLTETDFIYWKPNIVEERPESIIQCLFGRSAGSGTSILESDTEHTPLVEYSDGRSMIVMNQLELIENFNTVPQAAILLRNILNYTLNRKPEKKCNTGLIVGENAEQFLKKTGLKAENADEDFERFKLLIVEIQTMPEEKDKKLTDYLRNGGRALFLPFSPAEDERLSRILGRTVRAEKKETYHLKTLDTSGTVCGISACDLFQYLPNSVIAEHSVRVDDGTDLMHDVPGNPWHDYYVKGTHFGFSNRGLICINKADQKEEEPYMAEVEVGDGKAVLSQIRVDPDNRKDLRIYSRILMNMNAPLNLPVWEH